VPAASRKRAADDDDDSKLPASKKRLPDEAPPFDYAELALPVREGVRRRGLLLFT
jgi:hypothetical protein